MSESAQSFENHAKIVIGYHRVLTGLVLLLFLFYTWRLTADFSLDRLANLMLLVALGMVAFYARVFPIGVQDRLIRLEERLRLQRLLPAELRGQIDSFSTRQLIALRFASDAELPDLARRVLDRELADQKAIKRAISDWRADHRRI
jgi:hypothetical protein